MPRWRKVKVGVFAIFGASSCVPLIHGVQRYGLKCMQYSGLTWYLLELIFYGIGAGVYTVYPRDITHSEPSTDESAVSNSRAFSTGYIRHFGKFAPDISCYCLVRNVHTYNRSLSRFPYQPHTWCVPTSGR